MRRYFIIVISILTLTTILSCDSNKRELGIEESNVYSDFTFKEIKYKNHEYILINQNFNARILNGVVHNPDCKFCNKEINSVP